METPPRDGQVNVMDLRGVAPDRLDGMPSSALVEALRRLAEQRPDQAQAGHTGFQSAL
jgi:FXSXX-COOH protein